MGKRKTRKQQRRPVVIQQVQQPLSATIPTKGPSPVWKRFPSRLGTLLSAILAMIGLYAFFPTLSINEDYSIDTVFPYNTSFSISNEGFWPVADLSVVCAADFVMLPWATDPSDKSSMDLHTESSEYKDFAESIAYKHRITLPCNHNVLANGHRIAPDAKLHIKTTYRIAGTNFILHRTFEFRTIEGWHGQQFWQYQ